MLIEVNPEFWNAELPIYVIESGNVIEVKPVQSENALSPILTTVLDIVVFLQPNTNSSLAVLMIQLLPLPSL